MWMRRLLGVVALSVVGVIVWWGFRDDEISPVAPEPVPPIIVEKTRQIVRKDGHRLWQFDARKIELSPDGSQTLAHNVSNGVLFKEDKPILRLSAPLVHLENNSNNVDANGGVKASGNNRFSISSRMVRWNYQRKVLACPTAVKANLRDFSFDAPYLQYKWDTGALTCDSPVELQAPGVRLGAKRLKASTNNRLIELEGDVRLTFYPKTARPKDWKNLLPKQ